MNYYKFLNFPIECVNWRYVNKLIEDYDLTIKTTPAGNYWRYNEVRTCILTEDFHNLLDHLNCTVLAAELFYTAPYNILPWHIDMNPPRDNVKLNFVWGSDSHEMQFGEIKDFSPLRNTSILGESSPYVEFLPPQIEVKNKVQLTFPALVNSGRPHRVVNKSSQGRWCLSIIITRIGRPDRILFEEAVNLLSEYVRD